MKFKRNDLMATSLTIIKKLLIAPNLIDKAVLERQTFKLSSKLSKIMSATGNTSDFHAIGLSAARQLGLINEDGSINQKGTQATELGFSFDGTRLEGLNRLVDSFHLSDLQKIIIDAIFFELSLQLIQKKPYSVIYANLPIIAEEDPTLFELLNSYLNTRLRESILCEIGQWVEFDRDSPTKKLTSKLDELINDYSKASQQEEGLEVSDSLLTESAVALAPLPFANELLVRHQKEWSLVLSTSPPEINDDPIGRKEYDAQVELLSLRQRIIEITLSGNNAWEVGYQLSFAWMATGLAFLEFQWLPARVGLLLNFINDTLSSEEKKPQ